MQNQEEALRERKLPRAQANKTGPNNQSGQVGAPLRCRCVMIALNAITIPAGAAWLSSAHWQAHWWHIWEEPGCRDLRGQILIYNGLWYILVHSSPIPQTPNLTEVIPLSYATKSLQSFPGDCWEIPWQPHCSLARLWPHTAELGDTHSGHFIPKRWWDCLTFMMGTSILLR